VITVGPVWAKLDAPTAITATVRETLSVRDPGADYTRAFKSGRWDGRVHFVKRQSNEFLSGLTWRVASIIRAAGHEKPEIRWPKYRVFPVLGEELRGMTWRPYQTEAVERWVLARRMVLQCPTRGGKTEIAIEGIRRIGGKTLWVTHLKELMRQTPQRFKDRLGIECSTVESGETVAGSPVVVGMVQTLTNILRANGPAWFRQFDVLVMDECHHAGADTWQAVAEACSNTAWRLGLSGTVGDEIVKLPEVARHKIEGALGPTFTVATTMELADLGFVATPRVRVLRVPSTTYPAYEDVRAAVCPNWRDDPQGLLSKLGGALFKEAYRRGITENDARNRRIVETAVRHAEAGDRFLVLCNRVPHADALRQAIRRRTDRPVWSLDGGVGNDERASVLALFKADTLGAVLVCTPFFREGVDVPQIDAGFLAGGGESSVAVLQALGRMLTIRPGKTEVLIYDCADGRDVRATKDYLSDHYLSRLALYEQSGFAVEFA
jgi:superfamily II DNA or RNA helicase